MFKKIASSIFLFVGIFFMLQGLFDLSKRLGYYKVPSPVISSQVVESPNTSPAKINISSLSLTLPVEPVLLKDGRWPTSQTGVSFLTNSGNLGKVGNLIFYGHNWKTLLGSLSKTKIGDQIILTGSNGQEFLYSVDYIVEVDQKDVSILADTTDERITLYTCTGFLDQKRLVVVAKRV